MSSNPIFYLAVIALALIATFILALQILGAFFKVLFIALALGIGFAAVRAWSRSQAR